MVNITTSCWPIIVNVTTSDFDWAPTCLDSLGSAENEILHDAQSSIPPGHADPIFNYHGELRDINQQGIFYFDAFENDSYEDINNVIDTCLEFHNTTDNDNHVDKNAHSCDLFFTFLSSNFHQK